MYLHSKGNYKGLLVKETEREGQSLKDTEMDIEKRDELALQY